MDICEVCEKNFSDCYVCGLPANTNTLGFLRLEDERVLCARDAKTAVVREDEVLATFHQMQAGVDRTFARFTSFPSTNLVVDMVDRIHLQELYALGGNDYHCPNTLGYTRFITNNSHLEYHISLMSGLPRSWLQATCAHELAHTWVHQTLSEARKKILSREAEEGFCELVAFLYSSSLNDEDEKTAILQNAYTRGQIDLFVAADASYGINDVLDWMRFGVDSRLRASEPARLHDLEAPQRKLSSTPGVILIAAPPAPAATNLLLKAVFWDQKRPLALINNCTLGLQEDGKARLGTTNVMIRCVAITQTSARIRLLDSGEEQELSLNCK